jgi:hypothetical protein
MHIELLWLVPIIAFMIFLFFVVLYFQRRTAFHAKGGDLSREVDLFNAGNGQQKLVTAKSADDRLQEMEKMINFVAEAVANKRRPFQEERKENTAETAASAAVSVNETRELREKLRTVFREYDIILSENYTLRAKVKQLMKRMQEQEAGDTASAGGRGMPTFDSILTGTPPASKPALHLYDDTRLFNLANPDSDDLSESDESLSR